MQWRFSITTFKHQFQRRAHCNWKIGKVLLTHKHDYPMHRAAHPLLHRLTTTNITHICCVLGKREKKKTTIDSPVRYNVKWESIFHYTNMDKPCSLREEKGWNKIVKNCFFATRIRIAPFTLSHTLTQNYELYPLRVDFCMIFNLEKLLSGAYNCVELFME